MATMQSGNLMFTLPLCCDCGLLSDPESTFYGSDEFLLYCESCRDRMDGVVGEIAEKLLTDPKIQQIYQDHSEERREELLIELAEDLYLSGEDIED